MFGDDDVADVTKQTWFVDLDWYPQHRRSFAGLAREYLCPKCREKMKVEDIAPAEIFNTIRDCCSRDPGFITGELPIQEIIFRVFLSKGNQPLSLADLSGYLREQYDKSFEHTSVTVIQRLLKSDRYYGLREFTG